MRELNAPARGNHWLRPLCLAGLLLFKVLGAPAAAAEIAPTPGPKSAGKTDSAVSEKSRYGELRIYHPLPGKTDAILERFRAGTWALRKRHGLNPLVCWVSADKNATNTVIVQLLAPASEEAAAEAWKNFAADPEFKRLQSESEARQGKTVARVETIKLSAPASAWQATNYAARQAGAFDLRLYARAPGKEQAFRDRWRDHAIRIYERHGMKNRGWWEAVDAEHPGVMATLFAHESFEAIAASIGAFHQDEEWIRIEKETEAGGKLRTSVTTYKLVPVDFSSIK